MIFEETAMVKEKKSHEQTLKNPEDRIFRVRAILPPPHKKVLQAIRFFRFARDWAGLEFLSSLEGEHPITPQFYGGSINHRFILIEDLGENHVSLVDSLTGSNKIWQKRLCNAC